MHDANDSWQQIISRLSVRCCLVITLGVFLLAPSSPLARAQQFPFGTQHQAYRSGTLMPTHFTRAQMNAHVAAYYDLFKSRRSPSLR
jgi:hypothetical protein